MPVHRVPELSQDALQLLQRLAEIQEAEGYRQSYEIDTDLLNRLRFPTEKALQDAVQSLHAHAHDYLSFWQGCAPIIRIDDESPTKLVPGPHFQEAWRRYQNRRREQARSQ